jgi:hypothetical protein
MAATKPPQYLVAEKLLSQAIGLIFKRISTNPAQV